MLEGQVALVTGGGRGIGQSIALRLAREGADIAIIDLEREGAESTAGEISALGRRAVVKVADVSDHLAMKSVVGDVVSELGRLDILINNAGVEKRTPFLEITPEDWRRQVEVNLSGTFFCTQAAAIHMAERHYGRVVNLSSVAGLIGPIDLAAYGASKAGVIGLTRAAALDLADYGITVNAIAPGPIETPMVDGITEGWKRAKRAELPLRRPEEIAPTAVLLAADPGGNLDVGQTLGPNSGDVMP